jgi:hypothetical protein
VPRISPLRPGMPRTWCRPPKTGPFTEARDWSEFVEETSFRGLCLKSSVFCRVFGQTTDFLGKISNFQDLAEYYRSCRDDYMVTSG